MDGTVLLVFAVHILGFTFWVGGLFTLALLMSAAGDEPTLRAKVGAVVRRVAIATDAAAGVAMVGGITLLVMRSWDLRQPWMHMKLTFVVGLLAVHGIARVRAKKLAGGGPTPKPIAAFAVLALAIAIVALAVFKPMGH
jgi:putative membrane protein